MCMYMHVRAGNSLVVIKLGELKTKNSEQGFLKEGTAQALSIYRGLHMCHVSPQLFFVLREPYGRAA